MGEFTFCYGVPVFDHKGNVIASISLSDIALSDQDASEIVADLKAAASKFPNCRLYIALSLFRCVQISLVSRKCLVRHLCSALTLYIFFFQPDRRRTPEHFKTKEQE